MATIGGLEIHVEMNHAAPAAQPTAPPPHAAVDPMSVPMPAPTPPVRASAPILRGYDPTIPLTTMLVVVMLVAAIGAAVHRSSNPTRHLVAAATSDAQSSDGLSTDGATVTTVAPAPTRTPATPAPSPGGSPAAIPPAESQSPATAQTSSPCQQVIDSLSTRRSKRTVDVAALMGSNTFPALPLAGFEHPTVVDQSHYDTLQAFMDDTFDPGDPAAAAWQANAQAAGFVSAETIDFTSSGTTYGAVAFRFATQDGALRFNRGNLTASCTEGTLQNPHAMPALSGGMNYLIVETGTAPYRATLVAGDTAIRVYICHCVQAPDDQALAGQWAQAVATQVGAA
jgi:hypothetical protein